MLDIRFPDWTTSDRGTGNMFILNLYDGRIMLKVRSKEHGAKPFFFKRISMEDVTFITRVMEKLGNASPETKVPIKFSNFDKQSKQWKLEWVLTFEKDSKMCYRIHVTDVASNQTYVFAVMGRQGISVGADVMSDSDRSAAKFTDLRLWFDLIKKTWYPASILPYDPSKSKGNWKGNGQSGGWKGGNGGGGYNRGGNNGGGGYGHSNGGQSNGMGGGVSQTSTDTGDDDNLPF